LQSDLAALLVKFIDDVWWSSTAQDALRVFQLGTEFEDQVNMVHKWKNAADVNHMFVLESDAAPAAVGILLHPGSCLEEDLTQSVNNNNDRKWVSR
jgi:hypothetical protein